MKTSYQWSDKILDCVRKYDFDDVNHDPSYTWTNLEMDINRIMNECYDETQEEINDQYERAFAEGKSEGLVEAKLEKDEVK